MELMTGVSRPAWRDRLASEINVQRLGPLKECEEVGSSGKGVGCVAVPSQDELLLGHGNGRLNLLGSL